MTQPGTKMPYRGTAVAYGFWRVLACEPCGYAPRLARKGNNNMSRNLIRRHAAAGLYVLSVAAALLAAVSQLTHAQEPSTVRLFKPYSTPLPIKSIAEAK
jgi:hypothetical protein